MKAKKIISLIVAMFILLTIISVPTFADDGYSITPLGAKMAKYGSAYNLTIYANTPGRVYGVGCFIAYDDEIFTPITSEITGCSALNPNLAEVVTVNGKTALKINSSNDSATYSDAAVWATIPFIVAEGIESTTATFELIYSFDDADLNGQITWLDGNFYEVAFDDIDFGTFEVNVFPAHTAPTFDVTIDGDAMSGNNLEAVVSNFVDNWNLEATYAYQWLADGVAIDGATDSAYALDADDFGKAISVKVTATVESDDQSTNVASVTSASTAAVTVPNIAPVLSVNTTRTDDIRPGDLVTIKDANATSDELVGGENTFTYTWYVNGLKVGSLSSYEIKEEDFGTGESYLSCVVKATNNRNGLSDSAEVVFTNPILPSFIPVESVELSKATAELVPYTSVDLDEIITPAKATDKSVVWSSSNPKVATVDANGVVSAIKEGTTTITVTTNDGNKTATCEITVSAEPSLPDNRPIVSVSRPGRMLRGDEITFDVDLSNNTGFTNLGVEIGYNKDVFTLIEVNENDEVGANCTLPDKIDAAPYNIDWSSTDNIDYNGNLASLTFKVNEDAPDGLYLITVDYYKGRDGDYIDGEDVNYDTDGDELHLFYVHGGVIVLHYTPGDINGDKMVDAFDATYLLGYLANWDIKTSLPGLVESALDTDGSGKVNNKDATRLLRYLAGWNGEDGYLN